MLTSKISKVGKVVICGAKGVGKTAILEQLIYGNVTIESVSRLRVSNALCHQQRKLANNWTFSLINVQFMLRVGGAWLE